MNPLLKEFLSSVARVALGMLAGILVKHGLIEQSAVGRYVEAASDWLVVTAVAAVPVVWAYVKARTRERTQDRQIAVAIQGPSDATVAEVKAIAKEQAKEEAKS